MSRHRRIAAFLVIVSALLGVRSGKTQSGGSLQVHFINVGHGGATLIRTPGGKAIFLDGGTAGQCWRPLSYLQNLGIDRLDLYVATSPAPEHAGCTREILSAAPLRGPFVDAVAEPIVLERHDGVPLTLEFVDTRPWQTAAASTADRSLVGVLRFGAFTVSLGSDIHGGGNGSFDLEMLAAAAIGPVDVYEAHDHGASGATTEGWLAGTRPQAAIITTGPDARAGSPSPAVLSRLHAHRIPTYWTGIAPGIEPAPGQDDVAGDVLVDLRPGDGFFTIRRGDFQLDRYPLRGLARANAEAAPFGVLDTPKAGTSAAGELAVTGWALDPVGAVSRVQIYRNPMNGEPTQANGLVFIANATFVPGARPDVQALYPTLQNSDRAGWGYLVLSNVLPNNGDGNFTISAYATNTAGQTALLGATTVTLNNSASLLPFGTIDTPVQGETVSGKIINFGWALTRQPRIIPTDGSTIAVVVDGQVVGHPVYNQYRSDVSGRFTGFRNSAGPVGYFELDTTKLSDGRHAIAWMITDDGGNTQAVGSRFFFVANGTKLTLKTGSTTAFNAVGGTVAFDLSGTTFGAADTVDVVKDGQTLSSASVQVTPTSLTLPAVLTEGRNDFYVAGTGANGLTYLTEVTLWAGSASLKGQVKMQSGPAVGGAVVTAALGDDDGVNVTATAAADGSFTFANVPNRTILLSATATGNRFASLPTTGNAGTVDLVARSIDAPSPINNNDLSQGTAGWNVGTAPVKIISHKESLVAADNLEAAATADSDLQLATSGQGPQHISRTFTVAPGTKNVSVRYQFVTTEFPTYFGTKYNDGYAISVRSLTAGGSKSDTNTMNALGAGAFGPGGAIKWRELSLPVSVNGDTVQIDLTVTNVGDGLFDSYLNIDGVNEKKLAITAHKLMDKDGVNPIETLQYLSAADHPYFGGDTQISGSISVAGAADDSLSSLTLEILQQGSLVATANLAPAAASTLVSKTFGTAGKIEIADTAPQLLFRLPSSEAKKISTSTDGTVVLQLRAKSAKGEEVTQPVKQAVRVLGRFTGPRAGLNRDTEQGGDDWVLPSVLTLMNGFTGIQWNDISNMNAGTFGGDPPHKEHKCGIDADGVFDGYLNLDAKTAEKMIAYLNGPNGTQIKKVYVTWNNQDPNDPFGKAIKNVTLSGNRKATDIIKRIGGHADHFHWRLKFPHCQ